MSLVSLVSDVSLVAMCLLAIIEVNAMRCSLCSMVQASVLWREYTVLRVKLQGFLRKNRHGELTETATSR